MNVENKDLNRKNVISTDTHMNNEYKSEYFKNFDTNALLQSIEPFPEEKQKQMMQTLGKMLRVNNESPNNMQIQLNADYFEKNRQLIDLKNKVETYEKENKNLIKLQSDKEVQYVEKIKNLEKSLLNSDKADIVLIQKQNKEYELQITNLNNTFTILGIKQNEESAKFKSMIGELMILKDDLQEELDQLENLKKTIIDKKSVNENKKLELVLKYNQPNNKKENTYGVRRTTRTEFADGKLF